MSTLLSDERMKRLREALQRAGHHINVVEYKGELLWDIYTDDDFVPHITCQKCGFRVNLEKYLQALEKGFAVFGESLNEHIPLPPVCERGYRGVWLFLLEKQGENGPSETVA